MPFSRAVSSAFANNDTLAFFSSDSVLHLWDVNTTKQKQQYLPSSHLTATFTCLSWKTQSIKQNKRRSVKSKSDKTTSKSEFIALGTATGEIVLYNVENGELVLKYSGGHSEQVNGISWTKSNTFYSCSNDGFIAEWDIKSSQHIDKWKGDNRQLYSLCIGPHSKTLLAAGKMIRLWDLKTKTVLQKFSGHTSPIHSILYLYNPSSSFLDSTGMLDALDGLHFISAACEDRSISAWQINSSATKKKIAVSSFSLPSEPCFCDVLPPKSQDEPTLLLVSTEDDEIVVFSHILNGHGKKAIKPSKSIKIVSEDAQPLKVICASFGRDHDDSVFIILAYGSSLRVAFERITLKNHNDFEIILIRKDPSKTEIYLEQDKLKLREPAKSKNFTSIAPGVRAYSGSKLETKKRKKSPSISEGQLTMEERITAQSADVVPAKGHQRPDSLAVLLIQGLQSNDKNILNQVLLHPSDSVIKNTVSQIPINYVVPLIKHLTAKMPAHPATCLLMTKWMKAALSHHSSFLSTLPTAVPLLDEVYQYVELRKRTHDRLPGMQGKLELMLNQIESKKDKDSGTDEKNPALFVYEEDSSGAEEDDENVNADPTDSNDEWNEMDFTDDDI